MDTRGTPRRLLNVINSLNEIINIVIGNGNMEKKEITKLNRVYEKDAVYRPAYSIFTLTMDLENIKHE